MGTNNTSTADSLGNLKAIIQILGEIEDIRNRKSDSVAETSKDGTLKG